MEVIMVSRLVIGMGTVATGAGLVYGSNKIKEMYPPVSNAPNIGDIVTKNGKQYKVITTSGHEKKTCQKIKVYLENKNMPENLYHDHKLTVTQGFAKRNASQVEGGEAAIVYIGIDANFPYEESKGLFSNFNVPYTSHDSTGNVKWNPIDKDGLNDNVDGKPSVKDPTTMVKPDYQVVHIEDVNSNTREGLVASVIRAIDKLFPSDSD